MDTVEEGKGRKRKEGGRGDRLNRSVRMEKW